MQLPRLDADKTEPSLRLQQFLARACSFGTAEQLASKSRWRAKMFHALEPFDVLTRVSAWRRGGTLAIWSSPVLMAAPFAYFWGGLPAVVQGLLMPATLAISVCFAVVKALQKSPWLPLVEESNGARELEIARVASDEAKQLYQAMVELRRPLYQADLHLLQEFNQGSPELEDS